MKVLVLGSGGREHALCWKIAQSPRVDEVICAPGNAGIASHARCVDASLGNAGEVIGLASREGVGLVLIGPEAPLVDGLGDRLREAGFPVFGPSAAAAMLEGSKAFAKLFMARHGVPTARFQIFDHLEPLLGFLASMDEPVVVKADGLAAGKGVILCRDRDEAAAAARRIMVDQAFGEAGQRVVVEQLLQGEEVSYLALVSGEAIVPLVSSQDHKALLDGDEGPNTGGMGAYCPAPLVDPELERTILETVIRPTVRGLAEEGKPFSGLLYAGLMVDAEGPQVLEFNVRFGDPETQPLMALMDEDIVPLLLATAEGKLSSRIMAWKPGYACCVVMASEGYPAAYDKGHPIEGLDSVGEGEDVVVFHAGTGWSADGRSIVTAGGRVLGVTGLGNDFPAARAAAYGAVDKIRWPGAQRRGDIGHRALARLEQEGRGGGSDG